jgi:hypothetical protein
MATSMHTVRGSLVLSFLALLSVLVRSYYDTRSILVEDFGHLGRGFTLVWILGFTAIIGGWIWALMSAARGSRAALIALLV